MPLFQIPFDDNENNKTIFNLKEFLHQWVVVEKYRRPSKTIQCNRCRFFHHTSQNCILDPRCIKWDKPGHEYTVCQLGAGKVGQVACCNCKQVGHPANYRKCPNFHKNIKKAALKSKTSQVTKGKTFAILFATPAPQTAIQNSNKSFIHTVFRETPTPFSTPSSTATAEATELTQIL